LKIAFQDGAPNCIHERIRIIVRMTESTGSKYCSIGNISWKNGEPIRRTKAIMARMISPHSLVLYFSDNEHLTQNFSGQTLSDLG